MDGAWRIDGRFFGTHFWTSQGSQKSSRVSSWAWFCSLMIPETLEQAGLIPGLVGWILSARINQLSIMLLIERSKVWGNIRESWFIVWNMKVCLRGPPRMIQVAPKWSDRCSKKSSTDRPLKKTFAISLEELKGNRSRGWAGPATGPAGSEILRTIVTRMIPRVRLRLLNLKRCVVQ